MITRIIGGLLFAVFMLIGITVVFGSWYTIDQGEKGVVLRNGRFVEVVNPGLGFKMPWFDSVVKMSTRTEKVSFTKVGTYSRDVQAAVIMVSVNHRLDPGKVADVYATLGPAYADRILTPAVLRRSKEVFGQFAAAEIVKERARLNSEIERAIRESVADDGIIIEAVQLEDIDFSDAYEKAIEAAMAAEANVKQKLQELAQQKVEADKVRTKAQGDADAVETAAKAQAAAIKLKGDAEAMAIRARGDALRENARLVELIAAERWDGKLPTSMIPGGTVPFIGVK